jgi:hypothetical protein
MKRFLAMALCLITVFSVCACGNLLTADAEKHEKEQFSISIPDIFEEKTDTGYDAFYVYGDVFVWAIKDPFIGVDGSSEWDVAHYANTIYTLNMPNSPKPVTVEEGLTIMEYTVFNPSRNKTYTYLTSMYKGSDAFWMVQLVCLDKDFGEYRPKFIEWAKTVKVK